MYDTPIPDNPGMPVTWWLFWFAVSLVIYIVIAWKFWRVMKRETRDPDAEPDE